MSKPKAKAAKNRPRPRPATAGTTTAPGATTGKRPASGANGNGRPAGTPTRRSAVEARRRQIRNRAAGAGVLLVAVGLIPDRPQPKATDFPTPRSRPREPLPPDRRPTLLSASVDTVDGARFLLPVALAGLLAAAALAVVGLPPVDLHGPLHHLGVMDPFCGGTRALGLTARGDLVGAWRWNPLSPLLAAGAAGYLIRTGVGVATGRWLNLRVATGRRLWIALVLAIGALEARQQALAPMLMRHGY